MIILSASIASYMITIGIHSRVGSRPRFFFSWLNGPVIMSISTSTSCIVTVVISISISTLTSVSESLLGILSVMWSHITLSIVVLVIATPIT